MAKKPILSFWQIWNMSFGFLGIQFGFALQNANVSRIFQTLGAEVDKLSVLWLAAPVTGLIVQPIIGHYSDKTWNRLGRRRPYFLTGSILASLALTIMPNSPALWVAVGTLWLMDASINISMEPFRAFVGDMLPSEQRTTGFALQSFFIGTGAVVASLLPYLIFNVFNIPNTAPEGMIPPSVKWSFYIGAFVFITAVLVTVITTPEYPPEVLKSFHEKDSQDISDDTGDGFDHHYHALRKINFSILWLTGGALLTWLISRYNMPREFYIFSGGLIAFGLLQMVAGLLEKSGKTQMGLVEIVNDFFQMPKTMVQLSFVQFFSWFALFAMWIYTTPAVTEHVFGTTDTQSELYNQGADWVGVCFAVYNGLAAVFSFFLPWLAKKTNRKITHSISLIMGGLGLISVFFIGNKIHLLISMIGVGIAWASILSMPYAILSGALPYKKMGIYMGIFNFFIVIPQIVAAGILGFILRTFFANQSIYALLVGGISMLLASLLVLLVDDVDAKHIV